MSTGSEQIRDTCVFLRSFKSSESPSNVTSASSNQAVSQAGGGGSAMAIIIIITGNRFKYEDEIMQDLLSIAAAKRRMSKEVGGGL